MPVCRFHGARRGETIRKGPDHWNYTHGHETLQTKATSKAFRIRLRAIEELMVLLKMTKGNRMPGRKPKGQP
jgi:hypothetical protein